MNKYIITGRTGLISGYQAVVINCVQKQLSSEIIAGQNRPKPALRASRTLLSVGDSQKMSLVNNSNTKDDPSDSVYGPKRSSKGRHPEGHRGALGPGKPHLCTA